MPRGFDALPEALRPSRSPGFHPHAHPVPRAAAQPLVDCGVYVDGHRLPGKYDPTPKR